jgi:hypothetical protein
LAIHEGQKSSRQLEAACKENVTFMALACGIRPDHSTLAAFVEKLSGRIDVVFAQVLLVCHEEGLLSGTHLSLDGLKLPANASREWSGSFKELRFKRDKLARKFAEKLAEHRRQDRLERKRSGQQQQQSSTVEKEKTRRLAALQRLRQKAERIGTFLEENEPKEGARGNEVQSNVTDNDSAKMQTSHGVVQGYNAQALVDERYQVILHGLASGTGQDHQPVSADCNYHSEANLKACQAHGVDAYIPDNHFRQRDPRFETQERHKAPFRQKKGCFGVERFAYDPKRDCYLCPQGKELGLHAREHRTNRGQLYRRYRSRAKDCAGCSLKSACIARGGARRSLSIALGEEPRTLTARMRAKIDTPQARAIYVRRLAIVEPVFANIRSNKGLDRFTYRGKEKANIQWMLFCLVHNIEKLAHFGKAYAKKMPLKVKHTLYCFL